MTGGLGYPPLWAGPAANIHTEADAADVPALAAAGGAEVADAFFTEAAAASGLAMGGAHGRARAAVLGAVLASFSVFRLIVSLL